MERKNERRQGRRKKLTILVLKWFAIVRHPTLNDEDAILWSYPKKGNSL